MLVIDSVNRKGIRDKRVTKGPYFLVGPKSGAVQSDFSRLSGIRGSVDQYELVGTSGAQVGSYTFVVKPFGEGGFPAYHRAVGDVAVFQQVNGVADPSAVVSCLGRKRAATSTSNVTLGPFTVAEGDRVWIVVENKDASTLHYRLEVEYAPAVAPSLDLQFAASKSLVDATTGSNLVDFTRASSGTYVGSDGLIKTATTNEPRFDHDPATGESLGLLVEESRTNLLLRSEEIDNASWTQNNVTISPDDIAAPSGTTTAEKIVETLANNEHNALESVTVTSSTAYTLTCYAKKAERSFLVLSPTSPGVSNYYTWFNLDTGTIAGNTSGNTATITNVGNGWYRCSITRATEASQVTINVKLGIANADNVSSYAGDGASGIYVWGAQLEAGAFPTSYIPTTDATVTRAADVASISGVNFTSWFNASQGTLYSDSQRQYPVPSGEFSQVFVISDGTGSNTINIGYLTAASSQFRVRTLDSNEAVIFPIISSLRRKTAGAYASNDAAVSESGSSITSDSSVTVPSGLNLVRLDGAPAGDGLNGTIRRITYWPQRLPNETLQTITQ